MSIHTLRHIFLRKKLKSAASFDALERSIPVIEFSPSGIIQKANFFLATMWHRAEEITGSITACCAPLTLSEHLITIASGNASQRVKVRVVNTASGQRRASGMD